MEYNNKAIATLVHEIPIKIKNSQGYLIIVKNKSCDILHESWPRSNTKVGGFNNKDALSRQSQLASWSTLYFSLTSINILKLHLYSRQRVSLVSIVISVAHLPI